MFARRWAYTLKLKDLLADDPPEGHDEHALKVAPEAERRLREFRDQVEFERIRAGDNWKHGDLPEHMDEVADYFNDVLDKEADRSPQELFNFALQVLYDYGDDGKRVWVE